MTSYILNLKTINHTGELIYLPRIALQKLGLQINQRVPIYFGIDHYTIATVKPTNSNNKVMYVTSQLKDTLMLPSQKKIMLKKDDDGIKIGPIIGILTTDYTGRKFSNLKGSVSNPFNLFFRNLLSPEPIYPVYYFVFTPDHINWLQKTIDGYFYVNNTWKLITVPFPDVVYNRVPNRTIEKKQYIEDFKTQYSLLGGKIFNSNFFNKWNIYHILSKDERTKPYIPETHLNPSSSKLNEMINKYPLVYLKPANGSLGLGIYKIIKGPNGYFVQYRSRDRNKSILFKNIVSLYKYVFSQRQHQRYVIQQGIELIDYQNNPVDFRVQLHKNHLNQWQVVAIGAKVAGRGSVTTHLRTGGKLIEASQFLNNIFKSHSLIVKNNIHHVSIMIAKVLEEKMNEPIGELGLDIGIDKRQNIWLFEVNSKPGRSIFKHPSLKHARLEVNKRLIEYAIFLSNFYNNNET